MVQARFEIRTPRSPSLTTRPLAVLLVVPIQLSNQHKLFFLCCRGNVLLLYEHNDTKVRIGGHYILLHMNIKLKSFKPTQILSLHPLKVINLLHSF